MDNMQKFKIMWKNEVVGEVTLGLKVFNFEQNETHPRRIIRFSHRTITRKDITSFIARQIFDKHNAREKVILKSMGLEFFNLWSIAKFTNAVSDRNFYWIKFEGEDLDYEKDIKTRSKLNEKLSKVRIS